MCSVSLQHFLYPGYGTGFPGNDEAVPEGDMGNGPADKMDMEGYGGSYEIPGTIIVTGIVDKKTKGNFL